MAGEFAEGGRGVKAPWQPEDAKVRVGASGVSHLIVRDDADAIEVVIGTPRRLAVIVAAATGLWLARPRQELQAMRTPAGEAMNIRVGERIIDAFLRQN